MQLFSRNKAIVALALSALALGACGDDVTVPVAPAAPTTLSITPPSATMNVGEAVNFAVQISNSASTLASCTSSSATVATATVSGSSCRVTAIGAGNATITAAASTGQSAAASVSVVAPAPAITALAVSPSAAQLAVGSSVTVVPTVNRANSTVAVVYTYTSATASVATVSATGMVTAVAPGTTTITVTAAGTGTGFAAASLTSAATITVSDRAPGLTALQVSPASAALTVGGTQAVTASAQGPRAAAATITYGTSAPAIATVSATGVITAVAAGTATITVTAQSTQEGAFAASSITGLVTVTVSNPAVVSINISALTQGPTTTSYTSANGVSGIVSAANAQVGQAIDINNTRDQIQMTATLATNGARVDSVVAYVANADGTNRTSVGSQSFPSSAASGPVSLYINTADFTADFTAGTAAVKFANGQKRISVSAFSGATELQSTNSQTVSFNNVDGYAASATAPAKSATNSAGQVWFGGPDSLTTRLGSATIVPVFYTAGRTLNNVTLSMRQGAGGETLACSEFLVFQTGPYKFVYGGTQAVAGDTTVVNCSTLESAADHVVGVSAATDNNGTAAPTTSYAGGFRTSTTVTAPVARKLDYVAPTAVAISRPDSGWVNGAYRFDTLTAVSTDAGAGFPGATAAAQKAGRVWEYRGCDIGSATGPVYVSFSGSSADIAECISSGSNSVYTIRYRDADLVGNTVSASTITVGVDKTAPLISWAQSATAADSAISLTSGTQISYTPAAADAKSGITDNAMTGYVGRYGVTQYSSSTVRPNNRGCYSLTNGTTALLSTSAVAISASSSLSCTAAAGPTLGTAVDGYRPGAAISTIDSENMLISVTVTDKAGNTTTATRRAMNDFTVPTTTVAQGSAIAAATVPTFNMTYVDQRMGTASLTLTYNSVVYRYPATAIGTAFGSTYTATSGGTAVAGTSTLTVPMAAPFMLRVNNAASTPAYQPLSSIGVNGRDAAGNAVTAGTADAVASSSVPDLGAVPTSSGTFAMLTSLSATGGAVAGAKVQLTGAATTTVNPYSRVDFYRYVSAGVYDFLGSSVTVGTSTSTTGMPVYTWTIDSYTPINPSGTATIAAAVGDQIVAMGVRSNGGADLSAAATINGASVRFTVSGLVSGSTTNVTVTGPNAFTQTVSTGNATITIGVPEAGIYTVAGTASMNIAGTLYTATNAVQSVTVVGTSVGIVTNPIAYDVMAYRVAVTGASLPSGGSATITFTKAGETNITAVVVNNVATTVTLPAAGPWVIRSGSHVTASGLTYIAGTALTGTFATASASATVTGTGSSLTADGVAAGDSLVLNGASLGTVATGGVDNANGVITLATALTTNSTAVTANAVLVKRTPSQSVSPTLGASATAITITYINTTAYRTWTWTLPTGVVPSTKLFYNTTNGTVTDSSTSIPLTTGVGTVTSTRANGAMITAANSQLRIDPVTVGGITYGNSSFSTVANVGAPALAGNNIATAYYAARMSTQFIDGVDAICDASNPTPGSTRNATVAALAGQAIVLTATGPSPNTATFASRLISGTVINETLPVAGLWAIDAPANVVFGGVTYRFVPQGSSTLTYASAATARTISVCLP